MRCSTRFRLDGKRCRLREKKRLTLPKKRLILRKATSRRQPPHLLAWSVPPDFFYRCLSKWAQRSVQAQGRSESVSSDWGVTSRADESCVVDARRITAISHLDAPQTSFDERIEPAVHLCLGKPQSPAVKRRVVVKRIVDALEVRHVGSAEEARLRLSSGG